MATRIPLAFRRGPRRKSKPIELINNWHIFRGDLVRLIATSFASLPLDVLMLSLAIASDRWR